MGCGLVLFLLTFPPIRRYLHISIPKTPLSLYLYGSQLSITLRSNSKRCDCKTRQQLSQNPLALLIALQ